MNLSNDQTILELIEDIKGKRLIPFIGAGFSKICGLPSWIELLEILSQKFKKAHGLSVNDILKFANNDPLKVAEFLYIINDEKIGPIRRAIEVEFSKCNVDILTSDPHVGLVNLNFQLIYTTNFDDLLERIYEELGLEYQKICTTNDLFQIHKSGTQIVKFHGDLEHEETLVFTETSYNQRLNLESAIDIKFRSDLLGKSVLFLGYGFNDINIRIIWFKLKQLMTELSTEASPKSYIITLDDNPVLTKLYQKAGIKTILINSSLSYKDAYSEFLNFLVNETTKGNSDISFTEIFRKRMIETPLIMKPFLPPSITVILNEELTKIESKELTEKELLESNSIMDKAVNNIDNYELYKGKRKTDSIVFSRLIFCEKYFPLKEEFYSWLYHRYIYDSQYEIPFFEVMTLALYRYDFAWKAEEKEGNPGYWFLRDKILESFNSFPKVLYHYILNDAEKWICQRQFDLLQRRTLTFFEFLKQCKIPSEVDNKQTQSRLRNVISEYENKVIHLKDWENILENGIDRQILYGNFRMNRSADSFIWDYPKELIKALYIDGEKPYFPPKET